jgi:hypothetical protein
MLADARGDSSEGVFVEASIRDFLELLKTTFFDKHLRVTMKEPEASEPAEQIRSSNADCVAEKLTSGKQ